MTSDQDLISTARSLGFADDLFRFHGRRGTTEFACETLEKIEAHFGHHIASRCWYADGDNSMPEYAVDYRNGDVFDAIRRIVPNCDETVWMTTRHIPEHLVPDARNPGHDVNLFEGRVVDICSILEESYGFEYFLVSQSHEWLVCENDHGILVAVGQTVAERLRELGPPTASDGGITMR